MLMKHEFIEDKYSNIFKGRTSSDPITEYTPMNPIPKMDNFSKIDNLPKMENHNDEQKTPINFSQCFRELEKLYVDAKQISCNIDQKKEKIQMYNEDVNEEKSILESYLDQEVQKYKKRMEE